MLSIAISMFFALSLFGSALIILMMFRQYRDRIVMILHSGLGTDRSAAAVRSMTYRQRTGKAVQLTNQSRPLQPVRLRAAA